MCLQWRSAVSPSTHRGQWKWIFSLPRSRNHTWPCRQRAETCSAPTSAVRYFCQNTVVFLLLSPLPPPPSTDPHHHHHQLLIISQSLLPRPSAAAPLGSAQQDSGYLKEAWSGNFMNYGNYNRLGNRAEKKRKEKKNSSVVSISFPCYAPCWVSGLDELNRLFVARLRDNFTSRLLTTAPATAACSLSLAASGHRDCQPQTCHSLNFTARGAIQKYEALWHSAFLSFYRLCRSSRCCEIRTAGRLKPEKRKELKWIHGNWDPVWKSHHARAVRRCGGGGGLRQRSRGANATSLFRFRLIEKFCGVTAPHAGVKIKSCGSTLFCGCDSFLARRHILCRHGRERSGEGEEVGSRLRSLTGVHRSRTMSCVQSGRQ